MFKELLPVLRDRAVLLTVTLVDADQIRVNIVPKKLKDGDNDALTTPLSVTALPKIWTPSCPRQSSASSAPIFR